MLKCMSCQSCHHFTTSPSLENQKGDQIRNKIILYNKVNTGGQSSDVNRRAVFAAVLIGKSRQDMPKLAGAFNMPAPPFRDSLNNHTEEINNAVTGVNK